MAEQQTSEKNAVAQRAPRSSRPARAAPAAAPRPPRSKESNPRSAPQAQTPSAGVTGAIGVAGVNDSVSLPPANPDPTAKPVHKPPKLKKPKPVRDSFTMPRAEYELIDLLKRRAQARGRKVKKSELLRAGILALADMSDAQLFAAVDAVPVIKTGRPRTVVESTTATEAEL